MNGSYVIGNAVRLLGSFVDEGGRPVDPTTIVLRVKNPVSQIVTSYSYSGGEITKSATGVYWRDFVPTEAGRHHYRYEGTGNMNAAMEGDFTVLESGVL